jgi:hypothetical protein
METISYIDGIYLEPRELCPIFCTAEGDKFFDRFHIASYLGAEFKQLCKLFDIKPERVAMEIPHLDSEKRCTAYRFSDVIAIYELMIEGH